MTRPDLVVVMFGCVVNPSEITEGSALVGGLALLMALRLALKEGGLWQSYHNTLVSCLVEILEL